MFVGVADDETDAGQRRNLFGRALRIATRHHDSRPRILSPDAPDGGARILIRACGHGASVHHDDGSLRWSRGACHPALLELAFESGAVSLSGATAEILYIVSRHDSIVTQTRSSQPDQAEAAVLRLWKHSRQKTGRPCVGRKGTVVCFPHPEQVA